MANRDDNLEQLRLAATELSPILDRIVFLGGCTTGLFITDPAAEDVRPTRDVDVITEVGSRNEYQDMERLLRENGFHQPLKGEDPICRWIKVELIVDLMPTNEAILGFSNRWYEDAIQRAVEHDLGRGLFIRVVSPPYFVATKLEAFAGRSDGDYYASPDMEDLMAIIDGRPELIEELKESDEALRRFISAEFRDHLKQRDFGNALPGLIRDLDASPERRTIIEERLDAICRLA